MASANSSNKKNTALELENYVEIIEEMDRIVYLGIGVLKGTQDIILQRFNWKIAMPSQLDEEDSNMGLFEKNVIASVRLEYALSELSKDENIPWETRYMDLLKYNYNSSPLIRRQLHPFLKDFVAPVSSRCSFYQEDREYREEYYRKRNKYSMMYVSDSDDSDSDDGDF
jgi:hypothetical protein